MDVQRTWTYRASATKSIPNTSVGKISHRIGRFIDGCALIELSRNQTEWSHDFVSLFPERSPAARLLTASTTYGCGYEIYDLLALWSVAVGEDEVKKKNKMK